MRTNRFTLPLLALAVSALLVPAPAAAKKDLTLIVKDHQGAPLAGVVVTMVAESGKEFRLEGTTNDKGAYAGKIPDFERSYRLKATKPGYTVVDQSLDLAKSLKKDQRDANLTFTLVPIELDAYSAGVRAIQRGNTAEAKKKMEEAIAANANFGPAHSLLSFLLLETRDYAGAAAEAEKAIAIKADDLEAVRTRYEAYSGLGDEAKATAALDELAAKDRRPTTAVLLFNAGASLFNKKNYAEARRRAAQAIEIDPKLVQAHELIGRVALAEKQWDTALAAADQVLTLKPEALEPYRMRYEAFVGQGDETKAYAALLEVGQKDHRPVSAAVVYNAAVDYLNKKNAARARELGLLAVASDPKLILAYELLARLEIEAGNFTGALEWGEKAIAADPKDMRGFRLKSAALRSMGKLKEAKEVDKIIAAGGIR